MRAYHFARRAWVGLPAALLLACAAPPSDAGLGPAAAIAADLRSAGARPGQVPDASFRLARSLDRHAVPGVSIAVVDGGRLLWARGFGYLEAGGAAAVDSATLFQAASISKPVAATAMLRMVDSGLLALDTPVETYLRSWTLPRGRQSPEHPVTLRLIASHGAGFTVHGFPGYAAGEALPTVQQILNGTAPANTDAVEVRDLVPGEEYRYSGGGYTVMQLLLSDVSGEPFAALMERLVLEPFGMARSTYEQPLPQRLHGNAATAHDGAGTPIAGRWHTYPEQAAAGLWTTPSDLMRWALAVAAAREGRSAFLSGETARAMLTAQMEAHGIGPGLGGEGRAFFFGHGGSNRGFKARVLYYPETGQGAAVMTNGDRGAPLGNEILDALAEVYGWPGAG